MPASDHLGITNNHFRPANGQLWPINNHFRTAIDQIEQANDNLRAESRIKTNNFDQLITSLDQ